jgi:predicted RecB family nuclease
MQAARRRSTSCCARSFVDLYGVVRKALRASVESYSIKKLEPFYGFTRDTKLSDANMALAKVQACLELGDIEFIDDADPGGGRRLQQG